MCAIAHSINSVYTVCKHYNELCITRDVSVIVCVCFFKELYWSEFRYERDEDHDSTHNSQVGIFHSKSVQCAHSV